MLDTLYLTKRNIKTFLRDKTAVFFSFLSVIILLGLYLLFMKNLYVADEFSSFMSNEEINFLTNNLIMSGVLVINTLTLSLGNLGSIVNDFSFNQMSGFIVTPVKRYKIIVAYYISSLLITLVLTLLMWYLAVIIIGVQTGTWHSAKTIFTASLYLVLYTFISTAFMVFMTSFVKSINAFGAISGIFGTFIGFATGIYMPLSVLPKFIQKISSLIPFTHFTIHIKRLLLLSSIEKIGANVPEEAFIQIKEVYGYEYIGIFGKEVNIAWIIVISCILALSLLFWASIRLSKKITK